MDEPTLATLEDLREAARSVRAACEHLAAQARELDACAENRFADAGAHLVPRRAWWQPPPELAPRLAEAERLVAHIAALDQQLTSLQEPGGATAGLAGWTRVRTNVVRRQRDRAASRLRAALVWIARVGAAAATDVPDVGPILEEASEMQARAQHLRFSLAGRGRRQIELEREIDKREQAEQLMGFDSLHLVACFTRYGIPAIESPYELEPGEVAYLTSEASLVRPPSRSPYTIGGPSAIPSAACTGIPHWMGSFRDRPAPAGEGEPDPGVLLLTSHRLAFVGAASVAIWLDAAVDMDVYRDGIAVLHVGAERPMILRVPAPRQVAFYVNWAMRRPAVEGGAHQMREEGSG